MPLFDWRYIKSCQIGIKQLSWCVILNLRYHLNDSRMKWYRRSVNPNPILFYSKINFRLLISRDGQRRKSLTSLKIAFATQLVFFPVICFRFARCTLAKRWCIHQPVNIYRNCLKRYLICGIILRSIAFLQKLQNEIKKKNYFFKV